MYNPSIHLTVPDLSRFRFPPANLPVIVPPPEDNAQLKSPIAINTKLYNSVLNVEVPLTIATCYIVTVLLLNTYNRRRGYKPWAISQSRVFHLFKIIHNAALVVFSGVTFYAMYRALEHTIPNYHDASLAQMADSLCKLHGPRGLGDAVAYNSTLNIWESKNENIRIAADSVPRPTDVGRLWNEGLAFWGWLFYVSKFYEVVDTFIILVQGKRCQFLQLYHHAGIMLTMWAGIRYMSPPIWLAVFLNSFIHTIMYSYFLASTLGVRVSNSFKSILTAMQITQFMVGSAYAAAHLFVKYDIPLKTAYKIFHPISSAASVVSSTASEMASSASSVVATATFGAVLKRMLLRAAGDEGVAENVRDKKGQFAIPGVQQAVEHAQQRYREETKYRTEYSKIDCIDTSGEVFAIVLNLLFLLPLTYIFMRFFYQRYIEGVETHVPPQSRRQVAGRSARDAAREVDGRMDKFGAKIEKGINKAADHMDIESVKRDVQNVKQGTYKRVAERRDGNSPGSGQGTPKKGGGNGKSSTNANDRSELAGNLHELAERVHDGSDGKSKGNNKSSNQASGREEAAGNLHELAERVHNVPGKNSADKNDNLSIPTNGHNGEEHDSGSDDDHTANGTGQSVTQGSPSGNKKNKKKNKKKKSSQALKDDADGADGGNKSIRSSESSLIDVSVARD